MKIESEKYKEKSIIFKNKQVDFNEKGVAEVDDELGKFITKNFSEHVWNIGKKPKKEIIKKEHVELNKDVVKYKQEIERLLLIISNKDKQIQKAKDAENIWRDEFEKLSKLKSTPKENKINIPKGYEDIYEEMKTKNLKQLKSWAKETLNVEDKQLNKFSSNESLIQFVFDNIKE